VPPSTSLSWQCAERDSEDLSSPSPPVIAVSSDDTPITIFSCYTVNQTRPSVQTAHPNSALTNFRTHILKSNFPGPSKHRKVKEKLSGSKARYTLPVSAGRVHGTSTRVVCTVLKGQCPSPTYVSNSFRFVNPALKSDTN